VEERFISRSTDSSSINACYDYAGSVGPSTCIWEQLRAWRANRIAARAHALELLCIVEVTVQEAHESKDIFRTCMVLPRLREKNECVLGMKAASPEYLVKGKSINRGPYQRPRQSLGLTPLPLDAEETVVMTKRLSSMLCEHKEHGTSAELDKHDGPSRSHLEGDEWYSISPSVGGRPQGSHRRLQAG